MARLNNGKLIDGNWHSGEEIMRSIPRGRRAVQVCGKTVKNLEPHKNYDPEVILKIRVMPDRSKGDFFKPRNDVSRRIIEEQIKAVSENLFKHHTTIDFDDNNYDWMTVERYKLPRGWEPEISPLMILFPAEYPQLPPVGFYLPTHVRSPHGHLLKGAYHGAASEPLLQGWQWYCVYINSDSWKPAPVRYVGDWRKGDSLFEYFTLVGEALASND